MAAETKVDTTPVAVPAHNTSVTPVSESLMALRLIRFASKRLAQYTIAVAGFLFIFSGILNLFELNQPTLNPFVLPITDLGVFFFGTFFAFAAVYRMTGIAAPKKVTEQKK